MKKDKKVKKDIKDKANLSISLEADRLAEEWNRTRDPGIRDQWYKCIAKIHKPVDLFKKHH